jgi:Apea-like HEPN
MGMSAEGTQEQTTENAPQMDAAAPPRPVPDGVIDPMLFELTMRVVADMDGLVVEYLSRDGYKYVPHRSTKSVTAFDSGWPNVGTEREDQATIAHGELFARERNAIHPLEYHDLPSFAALDEYVRTTSKVLERVSLTGAGEIPDTEIHQRFLQYWIEDLPASIYDRAMALGLNVADSDVVELYLQLEKSWLAPELPYQLVAPLVVMDIETDADVLEIDDRTRLVRLTDDDLRQMSRTVDYGGISGPLADAARWAVVIDMPPMHNPGRGRRMFAAEPDVDCPAIEDAVNALRVVADVHTGWARVFRRPLGWADIWKDALPPLNHVQSVRRYPADLDDRGWLRTNRGLSADEAAQIPQVAEAMRTADEKAQLAIRRLSMAMVRDAPDDQLIDACIGLEALLGQKGSELSYRIALRASALLATKQDGHWVPQVVFRMARKVYDRRSELVHGSTSAKNATFQFRPGDPPYSINSVAILLLREVLRERLLRPDWQVEELDNLVVASLSPEKATEEADQSPDGDDR